MIFSINGEKNTLSFPNFGQLSFVMRLICLLDDFFPLYSQEVEERMKGQSPVMFEDFVKPYQIDPDQVQSLILYLQFGWCYAKTCGR